MILAFALLLQLAASVPTAPKVNTSALAAVQTAKVIHGDIEVAIGKSGQRGTWKRVVCHFTSGTFP